MAEVALRGHQVGVETIRGTSVPATHKIYGEGGWGKKSLDQEPVVVQGSLDGRVGTRQGVASYEGDFTMPLDVRMLPEIFLAAIKGGVTAAQIAATTAYTWTFTPSATDDLDTLTWEWDDANKAWDVQYVVIDELVISGNSSEGEVTVELTMLAQGREESTKTSLSSFAIYPIQGWESKLYIDAFGGTAGATEKAGTLIDFEWSLKNNWVAQYRSDNTQQPTGFSRGQREVDLSLTFEANSSGDTELAAWEARTQQLIRLELGNNRVIEDANLEKLTLDTPGAWSEMEISDDEGVTTYEGSFHSIYDPTNGFQFDVEVINDRAT